MKMITDKQKKFINDIKDVITENGINAIDALDLNKFTCYDASKDEAKKVILELTMLQIFAENFGVEI